MTSGDRVVWSEGMFLRTQHFQQQDRWIEGLCPRCRSPGWPAMPGAFRRLELNTGLLTTGKIALTAAEGRLPDGTPFSIPGRCRPSGAAAARGRHPRGDRPSLPASVQPGAPEVDADGTAGDRGPPARYGDRGTDLIAGMDAAPRSRSRAPLFSLRHERDEHGRLRRVGRRADQRPRRPTAASPSTPIHPASLTFSAHPSLPSFLDELEGKLESIADDARVRLYLESPWRAAPPTSRTCWCWSWSTGRSRGRASARAGHVAPRGPLPFPGRLGRRDGDLRRAGDRRPPAFPTYRHDRSRGQPSCR